MRKENNVWKVPNCETYMCRIVKTIWKTIVFRFFFRGPQQTNHSFWTFEKRNDNTIVFLNIFAKKYELFDLILIYQYSIVSVKKNVLELILKNLKLFCPNCKERFKTAVWIIRDIFFKIQMLHYLLFSLVGVKSIYLLFSIKKKLG